MSERFGFCVRFGLFVVLSAACASGQQLDLGTMRTVGDFYQMTQAELVKSQGVFIRTVYNHGCLNSGCCNLLFGQVHYDENCPLWTWLRWSFQGPIVIAHKVFMKKCLECRNGRPDCAVGTATCTGSHSQKWNLGLHLNRTTAHGDLLFSIHNHLFPHQCATIDTESGNGLVLKDCLDPPIDEQLFYVDRDWFQTAMSAHKLVHVRESHFGNSSRSSQFRY